MTAKNENLAVETRAFWAFQKSHDDLMAFYLLTQTPGLNIGSAINSDNWVSNLELDESMMRSLVRIAGTGKSIAAKLAIVYLVAIMEAYVKDALLELLNRKARETNYQLMGKPVPTDELEDIGIEIELEEMKEKTEYPSYLLAKFSRAYVEQQTRNDAVNKGIKLLKDYFDISMEDVQDHRRKLDEVKELRNSIVHHRGPEHQLLTFGAKEESKTIDEVVISPEYLSGALKDVFNFAYAIERGIFDSLHKD
jgi:hypothetical protein